MTTTLLNSPAEIVRAALIEVGVADDPSPWMDLVNGNGGVKPSNTMWPVFVWGEPSNPDNCITLYDTDGIDHGQSMVDLQLFAHYGIQVRIRSTDQRTG